MNKVQEEESEQSQKSKWSKFVETITDKEENAQMVRPNRSLPKVDKVGEIRRRHRTPAKQEENTGFDGSDSSARAWITRVLIMELQVVCKPGKWTVDKHSIDAGICTCCRRSKCWAAMQISAPKPRVVQTLKAADNGLLGGARSRPVQDRCLDTLFIVVEDDLRQVWKFGKRWSWYKCCLEFLLVTGCHKIVSF
jgi:hypothetical protein